MYPLPHRECICACFAENVSVIRQIIAELRFAPMVEISVRSPRRTGGIAHSVRVVGYNVGNVVRSIGAVLAEPEEIKHPDKLILHAALRLRSNRITFGSNRPSRPKYRFSCPKLPLNYSGQVNNGNQHQCCRKP